MSNFLYNYNDYISDIDNLVSNGDNITDFSNALQNSYQVVSKEAQFRINMGKLETFNSIVVVMVGIVVVALAYILSCYLLMHQGRKRNITDDWEAYVPIVKSVYRMDLVRESRWKLFFVGGVAEFLMGLLAACVYWVGTSEVVGGVAVVEFLMITYIIICIVFKYFYDRKFFAAFNYNPNAAYIGLVQGISVLYVIIYWLARIGALQNGSIMIDSWDWKIFRYLYEVSQGLIILTALFYIVANFQAAFSENSVTARLVDPISPPPSGRGKITCVMGMYNGAEFDVESDFEVIIGRDSYYASIVITENKGTISRKHCGIRYIPTNGSYEVTDYSSNGTYTASGEKLPKNMPQILPKGTTICLGDKTNRFKLM